MSYDRATTKF
ncbi:hypothetical protein LEMLEM_LOCUS14408 [Lemmus lemmus]